MAREALTRRRFSGQRTLPCLFRERETVVSNILLAWRCMWDLARIFCGGSWCLERRSLENHQESSGYGISSAHQACASHLGMLAKGLGNWLWECSSLGNYREPEESRWEASYSFGSSSQAQRLHGSSIHWSHRCFFLFSHRADRRCTMWRWELWRCQAMPLWVGEEFEWSVQDLPCIIQLHRNWYLLCQGRKNLPNSWQASPE